MGHADFRESAPPTIPLSYGAIRWIDTDKDGLQDLFITGTNFDPGTVSTRLLKNLGNGDWEDIEIDNGALITGGQQWTDYDHDGDLDVAMSGWKLGTGHWLTPNTILRNEGDDLFAPVPIVLPELQYGSLEWADYDNDGDAELLISGRWASPLNDACIAKVLEFEGTELTDAALDLMGVHYGKAQYGDYDGDGRLDIALCGDTGDYPAPPLTVIYRNTGGPANTRPAAPGNLGAVATADGITFSWDAAVDAETPSQSLTYNLRVGTTPGGVDVVSSMADPVTGKRYVPRMGNVQMVRQWTLRKVPAGTYFWSVQAIDTGYEGSPWAAEQMIVKPPALMGAGSRKSHAHGETGPIDLDIPLALDGTATSEPRAGGLERLVLAFDGPVTLDCANVSLSAGTCMQATPADGGLTWIVELAEAGEAPCVEVHLTGLALAEGGPDMLRIRNLTGDVDNSGGITIVDLSGTKAALLAAQPLDADNARYDVDLSGGFSIIDLSTVKGHMSEAAACP